jgi:hypothetical protein
MKVLCSFALLFFTVASADAQTLATLRVKSEKTAGGIVTLVLQSGNVIEVLESDLYGMVKGGAPAAPVALGSLPPVNVVPQAPSFTLPPASSTAPAAGDIQGTIRAHCTKEWPTDYRMQSYCQQQQQEAAVKMGQRLQAGFKNTPQGQTILLQCFKEWPTDYRMQNYCIEQQIEGFNKLSR